MTTGRINQIARLQPQRGTVDVNRISGAGGPGNGGFDSPRGPRAPTPRRGRTPGRNELSWKGRTSARPRRQHPGAPGDRDVTIQLPPLKAPRTLVRTQEIPPGDALTGAGGLRHTGLGRGVRTPWPTPTNGGSHGTAPPGNLGIETGQRPTIHRLQRCRGRRGPRASVTTRRRRRRATRHD